MQVLMTASKQSQDGTVFHPDVFVCDQETSKMRRLKPTTGLWKIQPKCCNAKKTNKQTFSCASFHMFCLRCLYFSHFALFLYLAHGMLYRHVIILELDRTWTYRFYSFVKCWHSIFVFLYCLLDCYVAIGPFYHKLNWTEWYYLYTQENDRSTNFYLTIIIWFMLLSLRCDFLFSLCSCVSVPVIGLVTVVPAHK